MFKGLQDYENDLRMRLVLGGQWSVSAFCVLMLTNTWSDTQHINHSSSFTKIFFQEDTSGGMQI